MTRFMSLLVALIILAGLIACGDASGPFPFPLDRQSVRGVWQLGENLFYWPQSVWQNTLVALEMSGEGATRKQYLVKFDLATRKKERVLEIPLSQWIGPVSIHKDRVVYTAADRTGADLSTGRIEDLNWDVYLFDLKTRGLRQITTEPHAQPFALVRGDTVVWLDARHVTGQFNPARFDVYTYDLNTNTETRLTINPTVEETSLCLSDTQIVWADNRHADQTVVIHAGNEPDYNNEIYAYDLATSQARRITSNSQNDYRPAISGTRVVWMRQTGFNRADVFTYNLSNGQETRVSQSGYATFYPAVDGNRVVWADARESLGNTDNDVIMNGRPGSADLYLYDTRAGKESRLVGGHAESTDEWAVWTAPVLRGNYLVFTHERQIGPVVYVVRLK